MELGKNNIQSVFANQLKAKRRELGWTQKEVIRKIGSNLRAYQYWEKEGGKLPRSQMIVRLAQVMDCSLAYFFNETLSVIEDKTVCKVLELLKTNFDLRPILGKMGNCPDTLSFSKMLDLLYRYCSLKKDGIEL
ncbi:MAG: helix-turn-helix transcriptional regulator [Candidatus Paceibacterota bacterium]|jgi:transcriptional regulator with XRE-family HTH domain